MTAPVLTDFESWIQLALMESAPMVWTTTQLDEALRQALAEYNQVARTTAAAVAYTIDDLDGASSTTLPTEDVHLVVRGAAALAANNAVVDQATAVQLGKTTPAALGTWAERQRLVFEEGLKAVRARQIWRASTPPWSEWEFDPDEE
jgi:hypothetical protein